MRLITCLYPKCPLIFPEARIDLKLKPEPLYAFLVELSAGPIYRADWSAAGIDNDEGRAARLFSTAFGFIAEHSKIEKSVVAEVMSNAARMQHATYGEKYAR